MPKKLIQKARAPALTPSEWRVLERARQKIERIRQDLGSACGLTAAEAMLASRGGLIAKDERWWWTEQWQQGEREAEREIRSGRTEAFVSTQALLKDLQDT